MDIRSITLFCEPTLDPAIAHSFFHAANTAFSVPIQFRRVAFTPFPEWWNTAEPASPQAEAIARRWLDTGANYVNLGPVQLHHELEWINRLPALLGTADAIFAAAEIADTRGNIHTGRCSSVGRIILENSTTQEDGLDNLYFAALANCPAGSPFFPIAYHAGGPPTFALAVEAADIILQAVEQSGTLAEAQQNLVHAIEAATASLAQAGRELAAAHPVAFAGIDFSPAPFPTPEKSLARAIESLGLPWLGASGSIFAAAIVAEAIDRADFPRCGFSGLMLPVLEDTVLADRVADGRILINDLLSWAAVCGAGLDTIPLAGNVTASQIAAILLDVAALAVRLDKPLTARLMPIPGLRAGDTVALDFPYFTDTKVMKIPSRGLTGLLEIPGRIQIRPRKPKNQGR
jgi:uncharacterized protein (UPF0210 family)